MNCYITINIHPDTYEVCDINSDFISVKSISDPNYSDVIVITGKNASYLSFHLKVGCILNIDLEYHTYEVFDVQDNIIFLYDNNDNIYTINYLPVEYIQDSKDSKDFKDFKELPKEFKKSYTFPTNIFDINLLIFNELDDKSLFALASVNKDINLSMNDDFWIHRIDEYFFDALQFKDKSITYKEYYRVLSLGNIYINKKFDLKWVLKQNFLSIAYYNIVFLKSYNTVLTTNYLDKLRAFIYKHINSLNMGMMIHDKKYTELTWAAEFGIYPDLNTLKFLCREGNIEMIKFFIKYEANRIDISGANEALINNHMDLLNFLETRNIIPDISGANEIAKIGDISRFNWLIIRHIIPDQTGVDLAVENGNLGMVEILISLGRYPSSKSVNKAAVNGHVNVIKYLSNRGKLF